MDYFLLALFVAFLIAASYCFLSFVYLTIFPKKPIKDDVFQFDINKDLKDSLHDNWSWLNWTWEDREAFFHARDNLEVAEDGKIKIDAESKNRLKFYLIKRAMSVVRKLRKFQREGAKVQSLHKTQLIDEEIVESFFEAKEFIEGEIQQLLAEAHAMEPAFKPMVFQEAHRFIAIEKMKTMAERKEKCEPEIVDSEDEEFVEGRRLKEEMDNKMKQKKLEEEEKKELERKKLAEELINEDESNSVKKSK